MINSLYDVYFVKNDSEDSFAHVGRSKRDGAKVGSGRYPLGSGKEPYQHVNKSKSSLIDKIFGKKKPYEFDYSYTLNTKENPDDYKLLRPETRNVYENLSSEIGGIVGMTSENLGYKLPGNKRNSIKTIINMKGENYDPDEIINTLENGGFRVYGNTGSYDKDCNLKSVYGEYKPFKKGYDDQSILLNFEPGSTFKDPKPEPFVIDKDISIDKNYLVNDNLKKYLTDSELKVYKKFINKMHMTSVSINSKFLDENEDKTEITFYLSPKTDQKKQIEEINKIIENSGYRCSNYPVRENYKLKYNEDLEDGLDYYVDLTKGTYSDNKSEWIHIKCPSIEGYAEEVGADITRWIVDD